MWCQDQSYPISFHSLKKLYFTLLYIVISEFWNLDLIFYKKFLPFSVPKKQNLTV